MMTSSNGNIFSVTGHLCGEITGPRSSVNSHTKASDAGVWCFLWSARVNGWVNTGEAGDLRRHRAHHDVIVMDSRIFQRPREFGSQFSKSQRRYRKKSTRVDTIVWGGCGLTGTWAGIALYSQVIIRPYLNQFWDRILPPYIRTLGLNELTFYSRMWKLVLLAPFWENCCGPCTLCCAILHKSWIKWQTFSRRYFQMHSRW